MNQVFFMTKKKHTFYENFINISWSFIDYLFPNYNILLTQEYAQNPKQVLSSFYK